MYRNLGQKIILSPLLHQGTHERTAGDSGRVGLVAEPREGRPIPSHAARHPREMARRSPRRSHQRRQPVTFIVPQVGPRGQRDYAAASRGPMRWQPAIDSVPLGRPAPKRLSARTHSAHRTTYTGRSGLPRWYQPVEQHQSVPHVRAMADADASACPR